MSLRSVGVEEELMLVDPETGRVTAVAPRALREHAAAVTAGGSEAPDVQAELYQQQIELATAPCTALATLRSRLVEARRSVGAAAERAGALAVAMPTPVLQADPTRVTPKDRYQHIHDEYGEIARQALVCAMHVHVSVDEQEAVRVVDAVRPWLPVLLALSANSPFWHGADTGYASWRSRVWSRWPTAGPREQFVDRAAYAETARLMVEWGAALDDGMLYFDVRVARDHPTVEIRVSDVCTEVDDAVLVAALARALVATAAVQPATPGHDPAPWRADLLNAAQWRAARYGLSDRLVHPGSRSLAPARDVVLALIEQTGDALDDAGDRDTVLALVEPLLTSGGGATRQRRALRSAGGYAAVVDDLARRTQRG